MRSSRRYMRTYASSPARRSNQTTLPCFACGGTAVLLADVDLDAPVARLVDVVGGRHEKLALAATRGLDLRARNADLDKEALHPLGTPCRQQIVPLRLANGIGMPDDHDVRDGSLLQRRQDLFQLPFRFVGQLVGGGNEVKQKRGGPGRQGFERDTERLAHFGVRKLRNLGFPARQPARRERLVEHMALAAALDDGERSLLQRGIEMPVVRGRIERIALDRQYAARAHRKHAVVGERHPGRAVGAGNQRIGLLHRHAQGGRQPLALPLEEHRSRGGLDLPHIARPNAAREAGQAYQKCPTHDGPSLRVTFNGFYNAPDPMAHSVKNSRLAMFPSRLAELRPLSAFLTDFCDQAGIERERCLRLHLVVEELFINTIRHGHRKDCDAPVWVSLEAGPRAGQVTYEDTPPPFNPYAKLPDKPIDMTTTLERRAIGGLGVLLTKELAATRDYAYVFRRNRIRPTQ